MCKSGRRAEEAEGRDSSADPALSMELDVGLNLIILSRT